MLERFRSCVTVYNATKWGPNIRMACSYGRYKQWEAFLSSDKCFNRKADGNEDNKTLVTFYGSNGTCYSILSRNLI